MKFTTKNLVYITLSASAGISYASEPRPVDRPDPEHIEVIGEKTNPNFTDGSINPFLLEPGASLGNASLSPEKMNKASKEKAKEKKKQAKAGKSNFWITIAHSLGIDNFQAWVTETLVKIVEAAKPELHSVNAQIIRIKDNKNNTETTISECTEIAINSKNSDTCAKIWINAGPNNLKIVQFTNLIYDFQSKRLVYTTDDTLTFYVNSFEELKANIDEIKAE